MITRWIFGFCALMVIALMILINIQVALSAGGRGVSVNLGADLPLLGDRLTINSLIDAQWHLLLIVSLLPLGVLVQLDRHIRVDFFFERLPRRTRLAVDIAGHLLLALPFVWLTVPAALRFMQSSWRSGEGSPVGGLQDLYLIKTVLLAGLILLAAFILWDLGVKLRRFFRGKAQ